MKTWTRLAVLLIPAALAGAGCGPSVQQQPISTAPPIANGAPMNYNGGAQMGGQQQGSAAVYQWQDVPVGQQIPVQRAVFDQGGYQIFAQTGETIVVPFVNNNLYAMKFGQTGGNPYFVNEGAAPILYLTQGMGLENAAAQGARWYPFAQNFNYQQPVYVGIAPSWNDYVGMRWYSGMNYYGGMWGVHPSSVAWMPGFYVSIGGRRYSDYGGYRNYYTTHTNYIPYRSSFNYTTRSTGSFGSGRTTGFGGRNNSTGSFGSGRNTGRGAFGSSSNSKGSFGSGRTSTGFGSGSTGRTTFGSGSGSTGRTSFGSGSSSGRNSFGSGSTSTTPRVSPGRSSSFGGGSSSSGYSNTPRSSSGSFGSGRSSSSSSSFGGGRSSSSSFGGGRRR